MKLLIILVAIALAGSLQAISFLGRTVTIGDFVFIVIIPLSAYLAYRQASMGGLVFGSTEVSMAVLLGLLPLTAYLVGMLGNGTFLNGYRSLAFALFLYVAGRLITSQGQVAAVSTLIFALVGYVLYQSGMSIADFRYGQDVTHLVGYEQEGLGNVINNLNLLGMLWCSLACLGVPLAHAAASRKNTLYALVPVMMIGLAAHGVLFSFSRSAYIYYIVVLVGFYLVQIRSSRDTMSYLMPLVFSAIIISFVLTSLSSLSYSTISRLVDKLSDLLTEFSFRFSELLVAPLAEFLSNAPFHTIFVGHYNQPQHSSASHYFVMFGLFGFTLYAIFQFNLIADGFRLARKYGNKKAGMNTLAAFSSFLSIYLLANDMATNALYYSPSLCYLAYFLIGLCRPYPSRYAG